MFNFEEYEAFQNDFPCMSMIASSYVFCYSMLTVACGYCYRFTIEKLNQD